MSGQAGAVFAQIDTNNDDAISSEELMVDMLARGVDQDDVSELFAALDVDQDGEGYR